MYNSNSFVNMAKSKSGGTRAYIRGRVGADVYSIGKTAAGKKQQVVRSLAETVANPQTVSQMRGRMIMSTVMQGQSALKEIIDHSFDGVVGVQANLSEFIKRNYALIKADVAANPSSGNKFGLNAYQEKGAKQGAYIISDGKAVIPAAASLVKSTGVLTIALTADTMTVAGLKSALSFGSEDYLTMVGINTEGSADYARLHINQALSSDTAISADNIADVFEIGGNIEPTVAVAGNAITVTIASIAKCCAFIITRKVNDGFIHSKAVLGDGTDLSWNADTALPTYPVGENKFLNGGSDTYNGSVTPTPSTAPTLTYTIGYNVTNVSVKVDDVEISSGDAVPAGSNVTFTCSNNGFEGEVTAKLNGTALQLTSSGADYSGSFSMPSSDSTLALSIEA